MEFQFPNGTRTLSIQNSPDVSNLLNDFMTAQGVFKKVDEESAKILSTTNPQRESE
ncbi:hypothetical protein [Mucilaginibacter panaciglaebae]|uniref:hypothetical protein n=1 Tax=Mucilaginibacter panaciglaebae TaxID=502331 RepID=UPI0031E5CAC9